MSLCKGDKSQFIQLICFVMISVTDAMAFVNIDSIGAEFWRAMKFRAGRTSEFSIVESRRNLLNRIEHK